MQLTLSNGDVLAYKKRSGFCVFHLNTVLLVDIGGNFGISHIVRLAVTMALPDGTQVPFTIRMNVDSDFKFNGETSAFTLALSAQSEFSRVDWLVVTIVVEVQFDFGGAAPYARLEQRGTLRPRY